MSLLGSFLSVSTSAFARINLRACWRRSAPLSLLPEMAAKANKRAKGSFGYLIRAAPAIEGDHPCRRCDRAPGRPGSTFR